MPSYKATLRAVCRAQTVPDLLAAIPQHTVGTAAMLVLCYLAVLPPLASLTYDKSSLYFFDSDALSFLMSSTFPYSDHWYRLMSTVIILSFLFIGYAALKLYYSLQARRCTLAGWLRGHKAVLFFGLLFGWAVVSFALSSHRFRSFFGTGYRHDGLLTYLFYIGLFCMAIQLDQRQMRIVLEVFTATGAFLGLLCVIGSDAYTVFYGYGSGFTQSVFLQRTHYGYYLSVCLPAGLLLLLTDDPTPLNRRAGAALRLLRFAEFWLLVNSLVFNATRAAVVAAAVFLLVMNIRVLLFHRSQLISLLCADALILATVLFLNTGNNLFLRTATSTGYAQQLHTAIRDSRGSTTGAGEVAAAADRLTSSRYSMWRCGIRYALQKPLFGWGPDNLGELYYADGLTYTDRPHNEFIQIAAMLGLPALGFYLCGLYHWLRGILQQSSRLDLLDFGLAMVAVSYLINSVFSNSMFYTTPYFFMLLGFAYKRSKSAALS